MGRSAKIHKRTKKKTTNAGTSISLTTPTPPGPAVQAAASASAAKKKAKLKGNTSKRATKLRSAGSSTGGQHVLGGADYVDIMMGSRRREREEASKLPRDTDVVS